MSEETKLILEKLDLLFHENKEIRSDIHEMKEDIAELKTDVAVLKTDVAALKTDVAALKTDVAALKTDVAGLKTDVAVLKTDVAGLKTDVVSLKDRVGAVETGLKSLRFLVENETNRKIDIIGEGHDFLVRGIEEARKMCQDKERMELEILNLKIDMRIVKENLGLGVA